MTVIICEMFALFNIAIGVIVGIQNMASGRLRAWGTSASSVTR
jgi:hypothetical protein